MMAQDEEECIARALNSVNDFVDEIIVIDGGSVDRTIEIARAFPKVQVHEIAFERHFARQKNHAIELASHEWCWFLDADEFYEKYVGHCLERLATTGKFDAFAFSRKTFIDNQLVNLHNHDFQIRFFRDYCRYEGKFHEQVVGYNRLQLCNLDIMHMKKSEWQDKDNKLYWNMGQPPPPGWEKQDGEWVYKGLEQE